MIKLFLTTILCIVTLGVAYAQFDKGTVLQPTTVVARHFDETGQLDKEMLSTFTYNEDGKLTRYEFLDHGLWSSYSYNDNMLMREYTSHEGGYPEYDESFNYTYENNKVKTKSHLWSQMNAPEYWLYSYDAGGRLERLDYREGYIDEYHQHWLYEYENDGKTKVESYYTSYQGFVLVMRTVYEYDESYTLLSKHMERFDAAGEITKTTMTRYAYTPDGKEESQITQTLTDGEWINTDIIRYVYDENGSITERQVGDWSEETGDWDITSKTVYELNEEESTLTVSFYKKNEEVWGWDDYGVFYIQPVFYESYLEEQQHALRFFGYDDLFGSEHINQFVFTLAETNEPTYESVEESGKLLCSVFPNPGSSRMTVQAPIENAVVRIYDLQGKMVVARPFDFSTEIGTEGWPSGMYLWEIWDGNQKEASGKWIKE